MADDTRQSRSTVQGSDSLEVPAFFATDQNAAELDAWKRDHPDWFIAGWWTPAHSSEQSEALVPPAPASLDPGRSAPASAMGGTGIPSASAAAPDLSVNEFLAIGKEGRSAAPSGVANDDRVSSSRLKPGDQNDST